MVKHNNTNTILVVDDDLSMRVTLLDALDNSGYRLVECSNGQETIDFVRNEMPDLILD